MRIVAAAVVLALAPAAWAQGGIEINEQSAIGVGMAGSLTAVADTPSAIFYNPAGLAFQPGFGAELSGTVLPVRTHVSPDNITYWHTSFVPDIYVTQRFGRHVAFGVGAFSNMDEHFEYPANWRGRFQGYEVDILTATIQPTLAFRITPWLAVAGGFDVVPISAELYRGLNFGGGEGNVHAGFSDVGYGGNAGLLVDLIPRHLRIGFSYRSKIGFDLVGHGAISAPPEVRALTDGLQHATAHLPLPHQITAATGFMWHHFVADVEFKASMWNEIQLLTVVLTSTNTPPVSQSVVLGLHNTWGLRGGMQYGFGAHERWRIRTGVGFDRGAVPIEHLGPLLPDTDRVYFSAGVGMRVFDWARVDLGYMPVIVLKKTSTDPNLIATYASFAQLISASVTVTWEHVLQRLPTYHEDPY